MVGIRKSTTEEVKMADTKLVKSGEKLHKYIERLISLKRSATRTLLEIGKLLYEIKIEELYAPQYDTFDEFIAIPELSFGHTTAYKAMRIHQVFVENYCLQDKIIDIDSDKLYRICGVVDNDNVEEWIEKARIWSRSDLNEEVNKIKGLPPRLTTIDLLDEFLQRFPLLKTPREVILTWERWKKERKTNDFNNQQ